MLTLGFRSAAAIENAPASGVVDLVGLARQLILDARLPKKLHKKQALH